MKDRGWNRRTTIDGAANIYPWDFIGSAFPGENNGFGNEVNRIIEPVNIVKENAFKGNRLPKESQMAGFCASELTVDRAIRTMKIVIMTIKYLQEDAIRVIWNAQAARVADRFETAEDALATLDPNYSNLDLRSKWEVFVVENAEVAIGQLDTFLTRWIGPIENVLADTDPDEDNAGRARRRTTITNLRAQVDAVVNQLTHPF